MNDEGKISEVLAQLERTCPSCYPFENYYSRHGEYTWKDYCSEHLLIFYRIFNWKTDAPKLVEEVKRRGLDV
jgi:hypothetical protein